MELIQQDTLQEDSKFVADAVEPAALEVLGVAPNDSSETANNIARLEDHGESGPCPSDQPTLEAVKLFRSECRKHPIQDLIGEHSSGEPSLSQASGLPNLGVKVLMFGRRAARSMPKMIRLVVENLAMSVH